MSNTIDTDAIDALLVTVGGDKEFLVELIDTFLEDAPGMLSAMEDAVQDGDAENLRLVSHSLKTNSAQFGATKLFELCRDVELQAKEGNFDAEKISDAIKEYENVRQALENLREV